MAHRSAWFVVNRPSASGAFVHGDRGCRPWELQLANQRTMAARS
jgi:hypothetical protein